MTQEPVPYTHEEFPEGGTTSRKATVRKAILLALLLLLLALVVWVTVYYLQNRRLPIPQLESDAEEVLPPEYLYSITGPQGENALTRPVGVAVGRDDLVYATDTLADVVRVYTKEGRYRFTFSAVDDGTNTQLEAPSWITVDAEDNVYVADRRLRGVYVFDPEGNYLRRIAPEGEAAKTFGPLGMAFDEEGNLYVTDVGDTLEHRVVVFDPDGTEIMRFGSTGRAGQMSDLPGNFYFPNGVVVSDDARLMIGDSNNRRVQVLTLDGGAAEAIVSDLFQEPVDVAIGPDGSPSVLGAGAQAIATTTDWSDWSPELLSTARRLRVVQGVLSEAPGV